MKYSTLALSILCGVLLTGCSTLEQTLAPTMNHKELLASREQALQQLPNVNNCCADMSGFPYRDLIVGEQFTQAIDASAPAFEFAEGKSHFIAYRLPSNTGDLKIKLDGLIDQSLFFPTVQLLDSQFKPTRTIGADLFHYEEANIANPDRINAVFTIDRSYVGNPGNESYLVIYTDATKLNEEVAVVHPQRREARIKGYVYTGPADPVVPHSPWGVVRISVEDVGSGKGGENYYRPVFTPAAAAVEATKVAPAPLSVNTTPVATPNPNPQALVSAPQSADPKALVTAPKTTTTGLLSETEAFYQQQIQAAVAAGDIDRAMQLVNEAERAGSTQARPAFVEAVKASQR